MTQKCLRNMSLDLSLEDLQGPTHEALDLSTSFLFNYQFQHFTSLSPIMWMQRHQSLAFSIPKVEWIANKSTHSMNFLYKYPMCVSLHHDLHHYHCHCSGYGMPTLLIVKVPSNLSIFPDTLHGLIA